MSQCVKLCSARCLRANNMSTIACLNVLTLFDFKFPRLDDLKLTEQSACSKKVQKECKNLIGEKLAKFFIVIAPIVRVIIPTIWVNQNRTKDRSKWNSSNCVIVQDFQSTALPRCSVYSEINWNYFYFAYIQQIYFCACIVGKSPVYLHPQCCRCCDCLELEWIIFFEKIYEPTPSNYIFEQSHPIGHIGERRGEGGKLDSYRNKTICF